MRAVDLIQKKRDGKEHSAEEISFLVNSYTRGEIPDYQMSAWMMALLVRGASPEEIAALTSGMLRSGSNLDLSELPGVKVDKHSTGGVGEKTSPILVPIVAAGGLIVPMISGRGLGHTGGTLDKLESIPGFNACLSLKEIKHVLSVVGCCVTGQTAEIVPADKKIYALRDVTATIESEALICASIMSKKLAEGIDALVLDVTTGSGAFMRRQKDAENLARIMVETGERMGTRTAALVTDMDQPLGRAVGNALEIVECVEVLSGRYDPMSADLHTLAVELAAWMFWLGEKTASVNEGRRLAEELIASRAALERFRAMVGAQGGDCSFIENPERLPKPRRALEFTAATTGYITAIECRDVGLANVALGGGRNKKEDQIDHSVGLTLRKKIGDPVAAGETIATIHGNEPSAISDALELMQDAYEIGPVKPAQSRTLVKAIIHQSRHNP